MLRHFYTKTLFLFAVLTMMWGGNVYGKVGDVTKVCDDFKADGNGFASVPVNINWDTQTFHVEIDLTGCSTNEDVFSFGTNPTGGYGQLHLLITKILTTGGYQVGVFYTHDMTCGCTVGNHTLFSTCTIPSTTNKLTFELSKAEGGKINGDIIECIGNKNGTNRIDHLNDLFTAESQLYFSTSNGKEIYGTNATNTKKLYTSAYSTASYSNVQLIQTVSGVNDPKDATFNNTTDVMGSIVNKVYENFDADATASVSGKLGAFSKNVDIDWDTQKFIADIDITNCVNTNENILSLGETITGWNYEKDGGNERFHFYYTPSERKVQYVYFPPKSANSKIGGTMNISSGVSTVRIEISKSEGLKINGEPYNYNNGVAVTDFQTELSDLWNEKNIIVGSVEGNTRSKAHYNTIAVVTKDYSTSTTSSSSNTLKESCVNSFSSQSNVTVQLDRSFSNDGWYTFCVPFNVDEEMLTSVFGEGVELRTFKNMSGTTMNFEAKTSIEAGVPYLLKVTQDVQNPVFDGVDVVAPTSDDGKPEAKSEAGYAMQGVYGVTTLLTDGSNLFLGGNNKFFIPAVGSEKMKGMRAYFVAPQGTKIAALVANIDGEETAIDQIRDAAVVVATPVYNLNGQCVGNTLQGLQRGIYVQNGKKYVVK